MNEWERNLEEYCKDLKGLIANLMEVQIEN